MTRAIPFPRANRRGELAEVRDRMRRLKVREAELCEILLAGGANLVGDEYEARVVTMRDGSAVVKLEKRGRL
jgi:chemotaxis response regulator CheB